MAKFIRRYPLAVFFGLAYVVSWGLGFPATVNSDWPELLTFLASFGPVVAAVVVVGIIKGRTGLDDLLKPLGRWRVRWTWYAAVLLGPAVMMLVSMLLYRLLGRGSGMAAPFPSGVEALKHLGVMAAIFLYQFVIVWGEEVGWRGFALPKLQAKFHPLVASLILGLVWGFWHLPSFWIPGSQHNGMSLPFFVVAAVGYAILYTWIYNGTGGSLWMVCLLHAANNTIVGYTMLFFPPIVEAPLFSLAVLALFVLAVIALAGGRLLMED